MDNIEKISLIDKNTLSQEFYLTSLLDQGYQKTLLSESDLDKIQINCLTLLAEQTNKFTKGDSSSVPVERAEDIMKSNLYTISLYLKSLPCPDDAINLLKNQSITEIYNRGRQRIDAKINTARYLHHNVLTNLIETKNYTYSATIIGGIKGFFKLYDPDFEAHEIHITADYPLANPINDLVGIEFISKYLESMNYENIFCRHFSADAIHHLLLGYHKQYQDLIFNIFEQVLTCAIGCTLADTEVTNLSLTSLQIELIQYLLSDKSQTETETIIINACHKMMAKLNITKSLQISYIEQSCLQISNNIFDAINNQMINKVFVQSKPQENQPEISFSFGDKMDDSQYRIILDAIIQSVSSNDKVNIIKNQIDSLSDLEDILFDAELSYYEIGLVLAELDMIEIAALSKKHPFNSDLEAMDLSEQEIAISLCLNDYILSLPQNKQSMIERAISLISE